MAIRRRAVLIATVRADELSLRALADVTKTTADHHVRIVGGQMASLLLTAFPQLHELAGHLRRATDANVPPARLATLIAGLVSRPG